MILPHQHLRSINPANLEIIGEVKTTPSHQVEKMVQNARQAFPAWRDLGLNARARILKKAQQILLDRRMEFAELITQEMGRPINESLVLEVTSSINLFGYYSRKAHQFLDDRKIPLSFLLFRRRKSWEHYEPLGVLGIIAPWNWPLLIPVGGIIPALLSGNAVLFKHSEVTPLVAEKIKELFWDAGVPESIFQIVQGDKTQGKALVDSSVEKIFFTGSTEVGQKIYHQASKTLKKCVLEMGGSDPAIVCDDTDIDITASGLVWGAYNNCGQNCNSIERIYVHEQIADQLIDSMLRKMEKLHISNGINLDTDIGPLASEEQAKKMKDLMRKMRHNNAKVLTGGNPLSDKNGYFFQPTLLEGDGDLASKLDDEIFGPVAILTRVKDDDEAIRLANQSRFGLASSVWTSDANRGKRIAEQIEAGTVMINDVIVSFGMAEAGWTGIKESGIGWVHGEKGLDEMVNIKYINREPQFRIQKFWWFPYEKKTMDTLGWGLDFLFDRNMWKRIAAIPQAIMGFWRALLLNRPRKDKL